MNRSFKTLAAACLFAAVWLLFPVQALAQATRTWVSGVGDDANPCSRTAPCKTFAGAISKTAAGGEISALDPGGYGAVTITKSITINGDGTLASIIGSLVSGVIVNAGSSDVVILRGISINGGGNGLNGVRFIAGGKLHIENASMSGFTGQGILFNPTGASSLFIHRTTIEKSAGGAIHVIPQAGGSATVVLDGVAMRGNGRGLRAEDRSKVVVNNSISTDSPGNGFIATAAANPVDMTLENTVSSLNGTAGVHAGPLATVRISNVTATQNGVGLSLGGGAIVSFGNNRIHGNTGGNGAPSSVVGQN